MPRRAQTTSNNAPRHHTMTEYHKQMNGTSNGHHHYEADDTQGAHSLEDSVMSLLSESLTLPDENKTARSLYRKCAKLFINKKFGESYKHAHQLAHVSVSLVEQGKIDQELFVSVWSLYFILIDMILNKEEEQVSKQERDQMEQTLLSDDYFDTLYGLNFIVSPKLVVLLTTIKMNNDKCDLTKLRQKVDLYFVHTSSMFNEDDPYYDSFLELLEVYHVHLLVKLGEAEESEFLIKSNPHIKDPQQMLDKVKRAVEELESEKQRKLELQRKKEVAAQKRREQRANERAKEKLHKEIERAKHNSIQEQQQQKRDVIKKDDSKHSTLTVLDVLKKRFQSLNNRSALALILSLLSVLLFVQNNRFLVNGRVGQMFRAFWQKLSSTAQMALRVTYM